MDLITVTRRLAWLMLAIGQLWLIYRLETGHPFAIRYPSTNDSSELSATDASTSPDPSLGSTTDISEFTQREPLPAILQRIDARLAALEQNLAKKPAAQHAAPSSVHEPTAREQHQADERLATFLPSGPLSREDAAKFHAEIQALPPEERFAIATALARAINEGRVQPGPDGI